MKVRSPIWILIAILVLSFSAAAVVAAQDNEDAEAIEAPYNLQVVNWIGEPLTFTIQDTQHAVAASGGELTLDLPDGQHAFTASIPGASMNGLVTVSGEAVARLSFALDVDANVITLFEEMVEAVVVEAPEVEVAEPVAPVEEVEVPEVEANLEVVNWIGMPLTFTIQDTQYTVEANGGELMLDLPHGQHSFTASAGLESMNGLVTIAFDKLVRFSFAADVDTGRILLYEEVVSIDVAVTPEVIEEPVAEPVEEVEPVVEEEVVEPEPVEVPAPVEEVAEPEVEANLQVVNWIGMPLTFTIQDTQYTVEASGGELMLELPHGEHAFTASAGLESMNGLVTIAFDEVAHLSFAADPNTGNILLYR